MANLWTRINTVILLLVLFALLALIGMVAKDARGGPLDPPGAPGSTDSVKLPGTPISSIPFTVSQSGHYYLTRPLKAAGAGVGIEIEAENVTIDLMGFMLSGEGVGTDGIMADGQRPHITVRNGTIQGWADAGVDLPGAFYGRFEDLTVAVNGTGLRVGSANAIERVVAHGNSTDGIVIQQVGTATGGHLTDSLANLNLSDGVELGASQMLVARNTFNGNGQFVGGRGIYITGNDNIVRDNLTDWNGYGIYAEAATYGNEFGWNHSEHNMTTDCRDAAGSFATPSQNEPPNDWGLPLTWIHPSDLVQPSYTQLSDYRLNICRTSQ